ncbi:U1 small nuclear ribonucleoprotein C-like [Primulina tabacum]|uniref:U1 small nuclear ribonucleoprotein C-like n=1 Tax=Primulina tabacum TaxID=48773 RepID=UPI003F5A5E72
MPRYYCDYCDTYLTHDSPSVRKQHNAGYKHKANVRSYYQQYEAQLNQSLIDQKVKEHLGAFRPPVAPYNQLRPGLPLLPSPLPGGVFPAGAMLVPGMRPPVLPRPMSGPPGYMHGHPMPQMLLPSGAPLPGQVDGLQRPFTAAAPLIPGSAGTPTTGAPPMFPPPPMYQGNTPLPTTGGSEGSNMNGQASEVDH